MWASDPTAGEDSRDLPKARALLDAAGWKLGSDGLRHRNGVPLAFDIAFRIETVTDRDRGVLIVAMLHDAGIDAQLKGYNTSMLYATSAQNGILASGHFQAALVDWYAGVDPDDSTQLDVRSDAAQRLELVALLQSADGCVATNRTYTLRSRDAQSGLFEDRASACRQTRRSSTFGGRVRSKRSTTI